MTAKLQHRRTKRNPANILLRVSPGDGRYIEEFTVDAGELRRFAWAALADLDPVEAMAAAAEDGIDLATVKAGAFRRALPFHGVRPPPPPPRPPNVAELELLGVLDRCGDSLTAADLYDRTGIDGISAVLGHMKRRSWITRTDGDVAKRSALWTVTPSGRAWLCAAQAVAA